MVESKTQRICFSRKNKSFLRRDDNLSSFYSDIRRYTPLGDKETIRLFQQYNEGNKQMKEEAFNKLFNHNIRLVISFARGYCGKGDSLNDMIQEGCIGLMKAIEMFDVNNGTPFSVYALYWIRRHVNLFRVEMEPSVKQTNRYKTYTTLTKITNRLFQKLERIPTSDEILELYNKTYSAKKIVNTNDIVNIEYVSIDDFGSSAQGFPINRTAFEYNLISSNNNAFDNTVDKEHNKSIVEKLLKCLTIKETEAIKMLYGIDGTERSLEMIAYEMKISPQRASQLCNSAINKMRKKTKELSYVQRY